MYNQFMNIDNWHQRYIEQAVWTNEVRQSLFEAGQVTKHHRILDVGCGTGVILKNLATKGFINLFGVDIDRKSLKKAKQSLPTLSLIQADANQMPFNPKTFDVVFCHYLLLWIKDPQHVLNQMTTLLRRGGKLMVFAEPDYLSPQKLSTDMKNLQHLQAKSLTYQGADPQIGRKIKTLMKNTGLKNIFVDQIKVQKQSSKINSTEIEMLAYDLNFLVNSNEIRKYQQQYQNAYVKNEHYSVSTFYGIGFKE